MSKIDDSEKTTQKEKTVREVKVISFVGLQEIAFNYKDNE